MDFNALAGSTGVLGALAIIALLAVWREWRKEAAAKDALYEKYVNRVSEIVGDYHEFAHTIDRWVDHEEEQARSEDRSAGSTGSGDAAGA